MAACVKSAQIQRSMLIWHQGVRHLKQRIGSCDVMNATLGSADQHSLRLSRNARKSSFRLSFRDTRSWENWGQWTIGSLGLFSPSARSRIARANYLL